MPRPENRTLISVISDVDVALEQLLNADESKHVGTSNLSAKDKAAVIKAIKTLSACYEVLAENHDRTFLTNKYDVTKLRY